VEIRSLTELQARYSSLLAVLRRCVEQGENVVQTWQTVPFHNHHMGIAITGLDMAVIAARSWLEEAEARKEGKR